MPGVEEYLEDASYKNVSQQYVQMEHNHLFPVEKMEQQVQQKHYSPESSIGSHILSVFYNKIKVCVLYIYNMKILTLTQRISQKQMCAENCIAEKHMMATRINENRKDSKQVRRNHNTKR
jgi:hypothetical protein